MSMVWEEGDHVLGRGARMLFWFKNHQIHKRTAVRSSKLINIVLLSLLFLASTKQFPACRDARSLLTSICYCISLCYDGPSQKSFKARPITKTHLQSALKLTLMWMLKTCCESLCYDALSMKFHHGHSELFLRLHSPSHIWIWMVYTGHDHVDMSPFCPTHRSVLDIAFARYTVFCLGAAKVCFRVHEEFSALVHHVALVYHLPMNNGYCSHWTAIHKSMIISMNSCDTQGPIWRPEYE